LSYNALRNKEGYRQKRKHPSAFSKILIHCYGLLTLKETVDIEKVVRRRLELPHARTTQQMSFQTSQRARINFASFGRAD
jgi:hypothetical protein